MNKTVADVMSIAPITARPEMQLTEVIRIMATRHISGLPVVDEYDKLIGIISETDLMWRETGVRPPAYIMLLDSVIYLDNLHHYERDLHKALGETVSDAMTCPAICIEPTRTLHSAAKMMHERKVQRLPVVDANQRVVGILTRGDIIRAMAADIYDQVGV
jgi:CBS domain-containing protein